jgi:hypothetical protein
MPNLELAEKKQENNKVLSMLSNTSIVYVEFYVE